MRANGRRAKSWIWQGVLGSVLCGCAATKPDPNPKRFPAWPEEAPAVDRRLLEDPLRRQARNGEVLESTLFNHHFKDVTEEIGPGEVLRRKAVPTPTSELLPAAKNQIHRLARRLPAGCEWRLFVEVARDIDLRPREPKSVTAIQEINRKRVEEVEQYARSVRPDLLVRVDLVNPDPVGMSGREASFGLIQHILSTHGVVRPDKYDPKSGETTIVEPPKIDLSVTPSNAPGALSPGN